jgi:hypothetical protein
MKNINEEIKISNKNESTRCPFWIIIDPKQNFKTDENGIYNVARMITGVWFSREAAQTHLDCNHHHFSKNAVVYCHSGCYSKDWENFTKQFTEKSECNDKTRENKNSK